MVAAKELSIDVTASAKEMADAMFGGGVKVVDASFSGNQFASGIYSGADETVPGVAPSDDGVILSTGKAQDFTNSSGEANQSTKTSTDVTGGIDNDADLNEVAGAKTFDAAIIEADFIPDGNVLTMQVSFSSEEYLEWIDSGYNDAVGIWVNGEQAELTLGDSEISIDEINPTSNVDWYKDNADDQYNTEMDGMTITLTLKAPVKAGEVNSIKIGIADAGDSYYDSNLMIAGDSVQCIVVAQDDHASVTLDSDVTMDVLENDSSSASGTLNITHINGQEVIAGGDPIVLESGATISLNDDGTLHVTSADGEDVTTFTYTVEDGDGNHTDGYATLETVPCFVAGTVIDTARGQVKVEDLQLGDLILTRDHGYQPLRWRGQCVRSATGDSAPIELAQGALGQHGRLLVSPQHRVLISDQRSHLLFECPEVLVAAKYLINDQTIRRVIGPSLVTYVHLLFDEHQVIRSNGVWSESYLPCEETSGSFDAGVQAEVRQLFPQLDPVTGEGYGPTARMSLRSFEAQALMAS